MAKNTFGQVNQSQMQHNVFVFHKRSVMIESHPVKGRRNIIKSLALTDWQLLVHIAAKF